MTPLPANAPWQPGHLICAVGAMKREYVAVPESIVENHQQLRAVMISTAMLLVLMSPDYQPPKVK